MSLSLERLTGRFVGLCRPPVDMLRAPGDPVLSSLVTLDSGTGPLGGSATYGGRGFGLDRREMLPAALGEAFERYSLLDIDDARTIDASVADLERRAVRHITPARLLSLDAGGRQGVFAPVPGRDQPIRWVKSIDLHSGSEVLLPAGYCLMLGIPATAGLAADRWYRPTTSGAAAAASPVRACLGGLLELLERDAFMLLWYHRLRFPSVRVTTASRLGRRLATAIGRLRLELRLINLTEVHEVPIVVAAVRGKLRAGDQYGVGGGAATTLSEAAWKAAKEALAVYSSQRSNSRRNTFRPLQPDEVHTFKDHLTYYQDARRHHELEFLFEPRPGQHTDPGFGDGPPPPPATALRRITRQMRDRGIDLYAVDLTPAEVSGMALFTFKVVSPQLVPLDAEHGARHLTNQRLLTEPSDRGWRLDRPALEDLNHEPHPFP